MNEVVANCDYLQSLKFRPTLPYAFTEQGIGQLSTVVHSKIAIERSIMIMNAFVAMRRFMVQNAVPRTARCRRSLRPTTTTSIL